MRSIYKENAKGIFVITCLYLLQGQAQDERSTLNGNSQVTPTSVFHPGSKIVYIDVGDGYWRRFMMVTNLSFWGRLEMLVTDSLN